MTIDHRPSSIVNPSMILHPDRILFEDNHLIIINKKPGEIVQSDITGDVPLSECVKKFLKEKYSKPGNVYLGTVHRIDRPVSGIVIFAKTTKALSRMNEMLRERTLLKTYWAVVSSRPPEKSGQLKLYLTKNKEQNKSYVSEKKVAGSLLSELDYKIKFMTFQLYLLEVHPLTGRPHQIRSMLSHIGCPIKGDVKYGAKYSNPDGSICLHSREAKFFHPVNKNEIHITAPPPDDELWNFFENQVMKSFNEKKP